MTRRAGEYGRATILPADYRCPFRMAVIYICLIGPVAWFLAMTLILVDAQLVFFYQVSGPVAEHVVVVVPVACRLVGDRRLLLLFA